MVAERFYNSRKSNLDKIGENKAHFNARLRLVKILEHNGYNVLCLREEAYDTNTKLTIKFPFTGFKYQKAYDIFAQKYFHDTKITSTIIIEVDGSIHNSSTQQQKDRYSEAIAHIIFSCLEMRRIDKDYVNSSETTDTHIIKALKLENLLKPRLNTFEAEHILDLGSSLDQGNWIEDI